MPAISMFCGIVVSMYLWTFRIDPLRTHESRNRTSLGHRGFQAGPCFANGEEGVFDCSHLLDFGVFRELRDMGCFKQAFACDATVAWPNQQEMSPDTLYPESVKKAVPDSAGSP